MTHEHAKTKRFTVIGGGDIQFCPYCGVTLDEAIDHEVAKQIKNLKSVLTSNCPEKQIMQKQTLCFALDAVKTLPQKNYKFKQNTKSNRQSTQ